MRLNYTPRAWQAKCHLERKRFTVLALHRRAGKTMFAVMELIDRAVSCTLPLGGFFYIAPQLKQSKNIAWALLKQQIEPLRLVGAVDVREGDLQVVFTHNGARISLYGADNPDAMRGVRIDGVVIDEVAQIKPQVWTDIVQPALSDRKGWALFVGTPAGINLFSELFFGADGKDDWHAARMTVYETDALDPDEVEARRAGMPEKSFAREYLCDFSAAGDDQLISLLDAELAAKRVYTDRDVMASPRIVGVDPARFGDDRSVIFRRQGLAALPPEVFHGIDNMDLAARCANVIESWHPDAVFIDAGNGSGVIDRLRQLGYSIIEVPFGGKATQANIYLNRRTEMWCAMADWLKAGGSIPDMMALKQELATPVYWFDPQGRKVLEPKDEIKKRMNESGSPDLADALSLTFAAPVFKRSPIDEMRHDLRQRRREGREHDPFAALG